jgi:hypothetical protein
MFAGAAARDEVVSHLNNIGNVMNMQHDARTSYDKLHWGIKAKEEGGEVRFHWYLVIITDPLIRSNTCFESFPPTLIFAPRGTSL